MLCNYITEVDLCSQKKLNAFIRRCRRNLIHDSLTDLIPLSDKSVEMVTFSTNL